MSSTVFLIGLVIVSSVVSSDEPQKNRERHVRFVHTSDTGEVFPIEVTLAPRVNAQALLPAQAAQLVSDDARRVAEIATTRVTEKARAVLLITELNVSDAQLALIERVSLAEIVHVRRALTFLTQQP